MRRARAVGALLALVALAAPADAEDAFTLDAARSRVRFTLEATLHTVVGEGRVASGTLRFDPEGGAASGEVVVDAASFATGIGARDAKMHAEVLLTERFPEIRFAAERLAIAARTADAAQVTLHGQLELHGVRHPLAVPARLTREGDAIRVEAGFSVPYVAWGLRDVSTFVLRVANEVAVQLDLRGELAPSEPSRDAP